MRSTVGISNNYIDLAKLKRGAPNSHKIVKPYSFHIYNEIEIMETLITVRTIPPTIIIILLMITNLRYTFSKRIQKRILLLTSPKFSLPKKEEKNVKS